MQISVIIPVYNVEPYLEECLASLCKQLTENIELIIINDGSTDRSGEIIQYYAECFPTIKIITQENRGLSAARNAGLDIAVGEYIWFIDGDDYIEENALEDVQRCLHKYPEIDMVRFGYFKFDDINGEILKSFKPSAAGPLPATDYFNTHQVLHEACIGTYRRKYLSENRLRFAEGYIFEDSIFNMQAYSSGGTVVILPVQLYFYRFRQGSLYHSQTSIKKIDSIIYLIQTCDTIIVSNMHNLKEVYFVANKKLDYVNLLIDHFFYFSPYTFRQKLKVFLTINHRIPVFNDDRPSIKQMKIFLNVNPKLYFALRYAGLKKGWTSPNI
ncbi:glycosyltransferase family 2 protein [Kaistella polysaccharea]|uniref:glycosyltransferase family 2 protein n=1 Tax=Kaistella polysaccharea TaxID=2878534 RepID=UPI001CF2D059|nr:glycosyltransferase [Kaistella polysaccharea]